MLPYMNGVEEGEVEAGQEVPEAEEGGEGRRAERESEMVDKRTVED